MRRLAALAVAVSAVIVGCGTGSPDLAADAVLTEGHIAVRSAQVAAGETTITIANEGQFAHTLVVATTRGEVVAATGIVPPGGRTELPVSLRPGAYEFSCRIVLETGDGQITDHYELGMRARVTAEA